MSSECPVTHARIASVHGTQALCCRAPVVPILTRNLIAYVLSFPELDAYSRTRMDINLYSGAVDKTHSVRNDTRRRSLRRVFMICAR